MAIFNSYVKLPEGSWVNVKTIVIPWRIHGAAIYGVPWIPNLYTPFMLAFFYQHHGFYGYGMFFWPEIPEMLYSYVSLPDILLGWEKQFDPENNQFLSGNSVKNPEWQDRTVELLKSSVGKTRINHPKFHIFL